MRPLGRKRNAWGSRGLAALALAGLMGLILSAGAARPETPPAGGEDAARREREELKTALQETASLIQKSEADLTRLEVKIAALEKDERAKKAALDGSRDEVAKLLSALVRMGRNPPPVMVTEREDALKVVRSAMLLSSAFPLLTGKAKTLADALAQLESVMVDSKNERDRVAREKALLEDKQTRLRGLVAERQKALKASQPELAAVGTEIAALSKDSQTPEQLIERGNAVVSKRTGLGDYDKQKDAERAAGKDAASSKNQVVILAPSGPPPSAGADRMKPAIPFAQARGRLPMPTQGRRVLGFSDKTQYGGDSKGTVFETRAGAQITSPCDGWIIYSSEFRSYGQLLIINAGDGYHVLLAGLSQVDVQPGQFVLAAEPVGTMSGAAAQGGGQANAPVLYVEFRKDNKPIDPGPWWAQKVQG